MKEAMLYQRLEQGAVRCNLCSHRCTIQDGKTGICMVRRNTQGTLYSLVYGQLQAQHVDPIEKKPLFHYYPGTPSFSIATVGCNFKCSFCQNWSLSQSAREYGRIEGRKTSPEEIVTAARRSRCRTIAYTYSEPTIFFEYAYDTMRLAHDQGIDNVFVTNGFMTKETLETARPYLGALNIDLKCFRDEIYRKVMQGRLQPVLDNIRFAKDLGYWVEVTTLLVPGMNDDSAEIRNIAEFVYSVGKEIPWHISAFHPNYRMTDREGTPASLIRTAIDIAKDVGLRYVYAGNLPGDPTESTRCYSCGHTVIERFGFSVTGSSLKKGHCAKCGTLIDGVGLESLGG
ncbi:MAG: AmmeMemoRadiSam system radical SAM enzyme [bacterium]